MNALRCLFLGQVMAAQQIGADVGGWIIADHLAHKPRRKILALRHG